MKANASDLANTNSDLTSLSSKFTLETGAQKFVAGYDIANDTVYIQVYAGSGKIYQLSMNSNNIKYVRNDNGTWTTLWTK